MLEAERKKALVKTQPLDWENERIWSNNELNLSSPINIDWKKIALNDTSVFK